MKRLAIVFVLFLGSLAIIAGCNQPIDKSTLVARMDSLQAKVNSAYVPGTGELMNGIIQPHHEKLWLAGHNKNWRLAEYERHMVEGGFKRIEKFHNGTLEARTVPMIYPALDSLKTSIRRQDENAFKKDFLMLTNACNSCHQATKYEFNVIAVPQGKSFDNQNFK